MNVQFGCGLCTPEGWTHFDVSPTMLLSRIPFMSHLLRLPSWSKKVRYGDISNGLPVPLASCDRVYSDQVLEHLTPEDLRKALPNVLSILKHGGVFRSFLPDLEFSLEIYQEARRQGRASHAASEFVTSIGMGLERRRKGFNSLKDIFGNSRHQWAWDEAAIRSELETAGFCGFRRALYRDSGDPVFDAIESLSEYRDHPRVLGFEVRRSTAP